MKNKDEKFLKKVSSRSTLTEKEALKLGAEVSRKLAKRYIK